MEDRKTYTANGVEYYFGGDYGHVCMVNPKTIKRYKEIKDEQPDADKYGVFFAFSDKQFKDGYDSLVHRGYIKEGDKIVSGSMGIYGVKGEIKRFYDFYKERAKRIAEECNPQEAYFYEWNNHEVMISYDDDECMRCIIETFGKEVAHTIERVHAGTAINILAPLNERDEHLKEHDFDLMMLGRLSFDCHGFFSEGDCRYHRPDCLWGGNIKRQVEEMRKLYNNLPDDIKDASCISKEQIDDYAHRFDEWATEEFNKDEYNPVPPTPCSTFKDLDHEICEKLYYKDDDGNWQTPNHVWFSCDSRRCHMDKKMVHGRAMTSYLGKNGTTLTTVYISDYRTIGMKPYRRDDLCDVSARYDYKPGHSRLYGFYRE